MSFEDELFEPDKRHLKEHAHYVTGRKRNYQIAKEQINLNRNKRLKKNYKKIKQIANSNHIIVLIMSRSLLIGNKY